jgi:ubiquinone/menaquinone biosynthesis C-methylase UbiE
MTSRHLELMLGYLRERHPRSARGVDEARAVSPDRFDAICTMLLDWLVGARGEAGIPMAVDAFVQFSTDVNLAQARYEADGHYENKSFADVYREHYSQNDTMSEYLWGIYLTNILWAHHTEISLFYRDWFLRRLSESANLVEIAPGHGAWGVWALSVLPKARLQGFDISPSSLQIATSVCTAAGYIDRASYTERNALDLAVMPANVADGVVCSFLVEHLEEPSQLFAVIQHLLKPGGYAFVTGALTAAQVDHIYEFRRESELVDLCEDHGLRVLATLSAGPKRTLPKARFLPRSMALIVQKRVGDLF